MELPMLGGKLPALQLSLGLNLSQLSSLLSQSGQGLKKIENLLGLCLFSNPNSLLSQSPLTDGRVKVSWTLQLAILFYMRVYGRNLPQESLQTLGPLYLANGEAEVPLG